jgi:DNA-directed RNA polymerase specialized sigma24 family protein
LFHSLLPEHCQKLRQFKGDHGCSLASWLRIIVARQVIDYLRKQSFPAVKHDDFPSPHQDMPDTTIARESESCAYNRVSDAIPLATGY